MCINCHAEAHDFLGKTLLASTTEPDIPEGDVVALLPVEFMHFIGGLLAGTAPSMPSDRNDLPHVIEENEEGHEPNFAILASTATISMIATLPEPQRKLLRKVLAYWAASLDGIAALVKEFNRVPQDVVNAAVIDTLVATSRHPDTPLS